MEVGTKSLTKGDKEEASDFFQKSYQLYSLFWGLNLGIVDVKDTKTESQPEIKYIDDKPSIAKPVTTKTIFAKLGEVVEKAIDCCKE
jgi:hypothetical protein